MEKEGKKYPAELTRYRAVLMKFCKSGMCQKMGHLCFYHWEKYNDYSKKYYERKKYEELNQQLDLEYQNALDKEV